MNGVRNSTCSVKSPKDCLDLIPLLRSFSSMSLPPFHSSADVPSNKTKAFLGGSISSVGLFRSDFVRMNSSPSLDFPENFDPLREPLQPFPSNDVLSLSVLPSVLMRFLPSQPSPGKPPGRNTAWNAPSPNATTWAPSLPPIP